MQKLILIALLGLVFIAITGAETEENSFDVIETEALEVRRVRAPKKNDEDKDNQKTSPKKKNRQAKQGKENGKEGGNGNSKDNDNDNDGKKNSGRVAKKRGRQAKENQEKKGDKKADRKERRRKLEKSSDDKQNKNNKGNGSGKGNEDKKSNRKDRGRNQRKRNLKQKQGKNGGKDKDKNESKEKNDNKEGKENGKNGKNKTKVRTIKKKPAGVDRQTTCPVTDACVSTAVNYLKIVQNQVANFKNQKARIERQNTTGIRKNDKKDVFAAANNRLVEFAGGNKTAPKCGSLESGAGVNNIKNLTNTLSKCSDSIKAACDISALPQPNKTFVDDCTKKTEAFETGVEECRIKSGADACTCWTKATLGADVETIKKCTLATEAKAMATAVTACKSAFSECRKFEDEVAGAIYSCSVSTDGLKSKLKSLAANTDAVTKAKDKINAIIGSRKRVSRQAAATCAEIISKAAELLKILNDSPASPKIVGLANSISTSSAVCSNDEKGSLKTSVKKLESGLASIAAEVAAVQATLLEVTGSTASASVIQAAASCSTDTCSAPLVAVSTVAPATTTPAPTTTKAPTGRRRRLVVEDILKSKLL